jgi:hypothetical protein
MERSTTRFGIRNNNECNHNLQLKIIILCNIRRLNENGTLGNFSIARRSAADHNRLIVTRPPYLLVRL